MWALAWTVLLVAMLSLPRQAWTSALVALGAIAVGAVWFLFRIRRRG